MVLIEAQVPQTVALGILLSFYLDFILILPYFRFRSVLPKIQASSGKIGEAVRATQRQQYLRYIDVTAYINGATSRPALIGEAGRTLRAYRRSEANSQRQYVVFADFCLFAALRLLAVHELQRQQYWRSIRTTKEQAKRGHPCAALRLLFYNSPINFAVVTGNGNTSNARQR